MPILARPAALAAAVTLTMTAVAAAPTAPPSRKSDPACEWVWKNGGGAGLWTETCSLSTGKWEVQWNADIQGFQLLNDGKPVTTVLQFFSKNPGDPISAVLPQLRAKNLIPDDGDCVFEPAAMRPAPRTIAFYEIKPKGDRLKALEATPKDQIPDPPCGDYGSSTHGVRYFQTDLRRPDLVVYVDEGQDGTMIDPTTLVFE